MNGAVMVISSALGGMLYGAVGAGVGQASKKAPVLKGSLVAGALSGLFTTAVVAGMRARDEQQQLGTAGLGHLSGAQEGIYFP